MLEDPDPTPNSLNDVPRHESCPGPCRSPEPFTTEDYEGHSILHHRVGPQPPTRPKIVHRFIYLLVRSTLLVTFVSGPFRNYRRPEETPLVSHPPGLVILTSVSRPLPESVTRPRPCKGTLSS